MLLLLSPDATTIQIEEEGPAVALQKKNPDSFAQNVVIMSPWRSLEATTPYIKIAGSMWNFSVPSGGMWTK